MSEFLPKQAATEEESYHQGTASMSTAAALDHDTFTPAPPPAPLTVTEPERQIPVHAVTQVLVVGGGTAGCAAALAARRAGAEVVLVERYNHLGGS